MSELVFTNNNQIVTSSRNVARDFKKEHFNILRDIEGLLKNEDTQKMFYKTTYIHEQNKQEYPMYLMNRDGFTLLAMGFTGKKAMNFKMKYISEFNKMENFLNSPEMIVQRAMEIQQEKIKKLELENTKKDQLIGELKPKADYTDIILKNKSLMTITQIAKDYGMSGQAMNSLLHKLGIQYKQSDQWLLYAKYHDKGYTHSETFDITKKDGTPDVRLNTKWTQKGRLFLYELLKENDILPTIERG